MACICAAQSNPVSSLSRIGAVGSAALSCCCAPCAGSVHRADFSASLRPTSSVPRWLLFRRRRVRLGTTASAKPRIGPVREPKRPRIVTLTTLRALAEHHGWLREGAELPDDEALVEARARAAAVLHSRQGRAAARGPASLVDASDRQSGGGARITAQHTSPPSPACEI